MEICGLLEEKDIIKQLSSFKRYIDRLFKGEFAKVQFSLKKDGNDIFSMIKTEWSEGSRNSEEEFREIIKPLLEGQYYNIRVFLIPGTKEISFADIRLYRNICYGGALDLEIRPLDPEKHTWIIRKNDEEDVSTISSDNLKILFKKYIIQKRALYEEIIKDLRY